MTPTDAKPEWAQTRRDKARAARAAAGLPPKKRWPWVVLALIVVGGAGWFALSSNQPTDAPVAAPEAPQEPVMQLNSSEVITIAPERLTQMVRVSGPISPRRQAALTALVGGVVEAVNVRPGDEATEGDVLVQIDTRNLRIQLGQQRNTAEATRAQLVLAESQLERTRALIERGLSTSSGLEQAESNVAALRANLAALEGQVTAAEAALEDAAVTAPFTGIVSARSAEPGQAVSPGAPLLSIVDLSVLEMQGSAPVGVNTQIAPGQKVTVTIEGIAGRTFEGVVDRVNPVAIEGTRTIPVYITLENAEGLLRGGMFATGQIVVAERDDAIAVPAVAIREDAAGDYVLKLENGVLARQAVVRGESWNRGQMVEISEGLAEGDVVVSAPLPELNPGDKFEMVDF